MRRHARPGPAHRRRHLRCPGRGDRLDDRAFSLFVRPVAETFDASILQASAGISLITLTLAACGVPVGTWLDRGARVG
jgi:hypothetical protein